MTSIRRGPFGLTARLCLRVATIPTTLAAAVALLGEALDTPVVADAGPVAAAATPWLTLPLFVAAITCCLCAAQNWPTFALRRDGADTVRRIERGPLGGRGAVVLGAATAQLALSLPLAVLLAACFDAPAYARRHREASGPAAPILDRTGASLTFSLAPAMRTEGIWLRPRASLPTGPGATALRLTSDGAPLTTAPIAFDESLELIQVAIAPRQLERFTLTQTAGSVPLLFGDGSVVAVGPADLPRWANASLLALLGAAASAGVLALAALLGRGAGWPTVASAIVALQFVLWIGGVGPIDDALLAVLRGRWLL